MLGNSVTVSDSTIAGQLTVYGVAAVNSNKADISGNTATIETVNAGSLSAYGSRFEQDSNPVESSSIVLDSNALAVTDVNVTGETYLYGALTVDGSGETALLNNNVTVADSEFSNQLRVYGARVTNSDNAEVSGNTTTIEKVTANDLRAYGARYYQTDAPVNAGTFALNNNQLTVAGTTVNESTELFAARARASSSLNNNLVNAKSVTAQGNRLTIVDSTFTGEMSWRAKN